MNQWIFLIDGYGMALEAKSNLSESTIDSSRKIDRSKSSIKSSKTNKSGVYSDNDVFKTFIVRFIGNRDYSFYNVEKPNDQNKKKFEDDSLSEASMKNPQSQMSMS